MTRQLHHLCKFPLLLLMMLAPCGSLAFGQQVENADFSSDSPSPAAASLPPSDNGGFYTGPVIPTAAMTTPARVLSKTGEIRHGRQIRIVIRFLGVDPETRAAIYKTLDAARIKTTNSETAMARPVIALDGLQSEIRCSELITTPSRATTAVVDETTTAAIMQAINQSPHSNITMAPSLVFFDGQTADVSNTVQRPFVTGFERVEANGETHLKSNIEVFDEGANVRLKVSTLTTTDGKVDRFHLATELVSRSIVDVKTDLVFGIKDEPVPLQAPLQQVKSVVAAEELGLDQSLLIDPFVSRQIETKVESGVPMLSKIPYVARSFKNISLVKRDQQMIVLLTPSIDSDSDH